MNLLSIQAGGTATCKSTWVERMPGEEDAPESRIIHVRLVQLQGTAILNRLGIGLGSGYNKCGSQKELDWVQDVVVKVLDEVTGEWKVILEQRGIPEPVGVSRFELGEVPTKNIVIEV